MKLLGWVHRKLRQNISGDAIKDFRAGPACNCLSGCPSLDGHHHHQQLSPIHLPPTRIHSRPIKDRHLSSDEVLLFEGLLSIGTLGSTPIQDDGDQHEYQGREEKEAQDFAFMLEAIAEKDETEATTETDLIVVNTELEKVLTEVAEKEGDQRLSSARPSHVGGKANEACPLQEFLLGTVTEVAVTVVEKEKVKGKRASLGELFMIEEGGRGEEKGKKKGEEVKKKKMMMMKRTKSHKVAADGGGSDDGGYSKDNVKTDKFQKILQIFHRKIHPEDEMDSRKSTRSRKCKNKYVGVCGGNYCSAGYGGEPVPMTSSKRSTNHPCGLLLDGGDSASGGEHWIKTDADYLVLELQNGNGFTCSTEDYPKEVLVN